MLRSWSRVFLGCIAGAIAVLAFHQLTLQAFFWLGLAPQAAFRVAVVPPFNAPMVVSVTFWGALYGGVFGWVAPRLPRGIVAKSLCAGIFALVMSWFVIRPLAGHEIAFGWMVAPMLRSAAACFMWGFGVTLVLRLLHPRRLHGRRHSWDNHHVAT